MINCGFLVLVFCILSFVSFFFGPASFDASWGIMTFGSLGVILNSWIKNNFSPMV